VTHDDVQAWLDAYVEAGHTCDPAAIAALFTDDATYTYHPWGEGEGLVRGSRRHRRRLARGAGGARLVESELPTSGE
jgi:SnoaL-like domain